MSEIPKAYEPQSVEDKWYQFWLDRKCFVADPARVSPKRPAYSIVIPPPNVTGMLTMGHVLNNTIQDILARKARMDGKEVLWLPGTDHAGIATQTVVEKTLKKAGEIRHRDDLGREKFLERVWQWKEKHGGIIIQQLKKLGASCDWTRERFTMDPEYSRCVQKVFVELYKKGLIYRGKRMVNWDPAARTALSDEEVEMIEEKGHLWHIKYPLLDDQGRPKADEFVVVATTRPETMLGDEAVAVNPKDPRFTKLVGRKVLLPLQNKPIPVITDELVDPKFGTGCVKVTPSHDPADYEMAVRHKLPLTVVIGPDGRMTQEAGKEFVGMDRMKARQAAVEKLTEQGLLLKTEDYIHNVGYSQRSHVPIEPYLSEQWFLKYPSVEKSRACVEQERSATVPVAASGVSPDASSRVSSGGTSNSADGTSALPSKMRFHPQRWAKVYDHWMENIKDWCISRQLWWGHRIPVWSIRFDKSTFRKLDHSVVDVVECICKLAGKEPPDGMWSSLISTSGSKRSGSPRETMIESHTQHPDHEVVYQLFRSEDESSFELFALTTFEAKIQQLEQLGFTQDPDVLDTWFSSWLWPFATMGWPEQTPTLKAFYPTTDLVTGPDIIFFWVARMIMAGYEFMGDLPFKNVYFTGIIRDKQGRKMSKSLGNSPDPLDLINKYGADALRFGTMRSAPLGQDILFDEQNVELGRNFCNKLWNACRFRQMQGGEVQAEINPQLLTSYDKWILIKLDTAICEMNTAFAEYKFSDATATLYRFFWSEYCDWHVEASKVVLQSDDNARKANTLAVTDFVLSHTLRLFHPFLPFITEELWHGMGYSTDMPENQGGKTIMFAPWPKPLDENFKTYYRLDGSVEKQSRVNIQIVSTIRELKAEYKLNAVKNVPVIIIPSPASFPFFSDPIELATTQSLSGSAIQIKDDFAPSKDTAARSTLSGEKIYMPLTGLIDFAAEKSRLKKELEKIEAEIAKNEQKLTNPNFTQKVPANVLEEHKQRLAEWHGKRDHVKAALAALG
jgi:valyl-tRNA synthetase